MKKRFIFLSFTLLIALNSQAQYTEILESAKDTSKTVNSPFTKSIGIFYDPTYLVINGIKVEGEYFFITKNSSKM